jgi:hypothetical protein
VLKVIDLFFAILAEDDSYLCTCFVVLWCELWDSGRNAFGNCFLIIITIL